MGEFLSLDLLSVEIIKGLNNFNKIKDEWEHLWKFTPSVTHFQKWNYQNLYIEYYDVNSDPMIYVIRDEVNEIIALASLSICVDPHSLQKKISFLGDDLFDYHMFLVRPQTPISVGVRLMEEIVRTGEQLNILIELKNIPVNCWTYAVMEKYFSIFDCNRLVLETGLSETFAVHIPNNLESYLQNLGTRSRRDFYYDRRRLQREHKVNLKIYKNRQELVDYVEAVEGIDIARWGNDSSYMVSSKKRFINSTINMLVDEGEFMGFILFIDDKPASYIKGAIINQVYEIERIGYDPAIYRNLSIGKITNYYAIEICIKLGIKIYDLTRGSEAYKAWLGGKASNNYFIRLYPGTLAMQYNHIRKKMLNSVRSNRWLRRFYQILRRR